MLALALKFTTRLAWNRKWVNVQKVNIAGMFTSKRLLFVLAYLEAVNAWLA